MLLLGSPTGLSEGQRTGRRDSKVGYRTTPAQAEVLVSNAAWASYAIDPRFPVLDLDVDGIAGHALAEEAVRFVESHGWDPLLVSSGTDGHYHLFVLGHGSTAHNLLRDWAAAHKGVDARGSLRLGRSYRRTRMSGGQVRAIGAPSHKPGRDASRLVLPRSTEAAIAIVRGHLRRADADRAMQTLAPLSTADQIEQAGPLPDVLPNPRAISPRALPAEYDLALREATGPKAAYNKHGEFDRSQTYVSVLLSAVNNGWSWPTWWATIRTVSSPTTSKHRRDERLAREEWNRACLKVEADPPRAPIDPTVEQKCKAAWLAGLTASLTGIWGTDPRVAASTLAGLSVAVRRATLTGSDVITLSESMWMLLLGTSSRDTVAAVLDRLTVCPCHKDRQPECHKGNGCANLMRPVFLEELAPLPGSATRRWRLLAPRLQPAPDLTTPDLPALDVAGVDADVWRAPGLGYTAWHALTVLSHTTPQDTATLAARMGRSTSRDGLRRFDGILTLMAEHGLLRQTATTWEAVRLTAKEIEQAAQKAGTAGTARARSVKASRRTAEYRAEQRRFGGHDATVQVNSATGRFEVVEATPHHSVTVVLPEGVTDEDLAWYSETVLAGHAEPGQDAAQQGPTVVDEPEAGDAAPDVDWAALVPFSKAWAEAVAADYNAGGGVGHAEPRRQPDGGWAVVACTVDWETGELEETPVEGLISGTTRRRRARHLAPVRETRSA